LQAAVILPLRSCLHSSMVAKCTDPIAWSAQLRFSTCCLENATHLFQNPSYNWRPANKLNMLYSASRVLVTRAVTRVVEYEGRDLLLALSAQRAGEIKSRTTCNPFPTSNFHRVHHNAALERAHEVAVVERVVRCSVECVARCSVRSRRSDW
jgi:hypothetical protein